MYNYKIQLQYDGGRYDGWQRMGKDASNNTIEFKIFEIIKNSKKWYNVHVMST